MNRYLLLVRKGPRRPLELFVLIFVATVVVQLQLICRQFHDPSAVDFHALHAYYHQWSRSVQFCSDKAGHVEVHGAPTPRTTPGTFI